MFFDSGKLKAAAIVVVMLAALAFFDSYGNSGKSQITGAAVGADKRQASESTGDAAQSGIVRDVLNKGETRVYTIGGKDYFVELRDVGQTAQLIVNKEKIDVGIGSIATLSDGVQLGVASIHTNYAGDTAKVTFVLGTSVSVADIVDMADCISKEGNAPCTAEEGQTISVAVDSKIYEVSADFITAKYAILTVNGDRTDRLGVDGSYTLVDGATLKVTKLAVEDIAGGKRVIKFTITATGSAAGQSDTAHKVIVSPGWNILGFNTFDSMLSTTCSREQIYSAVQVYNPEKEGGEGYDIFELDQSMKLIPQGNFVNPASAGWVYNYGDSCAIHSTLPSEGQMSLQHGWNMLSAAPGFVGKTFKDIYQAQGCKITGGWLFHPERSDPWEYLDAGTTQFSGADTGHGFWIYCAPESQGMMV